MDQTPTLTISDPKKMSDDELDKHIYQACVAMESIHIQWKYFCPIRGNKALLTLLTHQYKQFSLNLSALLKEKQFRAISMR